MENLDPQSSIMKKKGLKTIEETYTKKTQLEHILLRPDTYVGSVEKQNQVMWVYDSELEQIVSRACSFVPGLYKIFDEIIVNAADNKQRDPSMNKIDVSILPDQNCIRVWNNGTGIPIVVHQEHKIYVPELIFGNLLTGSNFDDEEAKTTGGRNGYGAKLANIFSTRFIVETNDKSRKLKYTQEFTNNMINKGVPVIASSNSDDFTCITFYPDLERFKMTILDDDIVALLSKRVFDIAATNMSSGPKLNVYLNGRRIESRTFEQYISIYKGLEPACGFEKVNDRWEIGVGISDGTFQQVSFVNSICTIKGGCHVNFIVDQITSKLVNIVKKKNKGMEVKQNNIKNHISVYVNALITNPAFDSQTKENLTTKPAAFGSTCVVSEKLMKQIEKSGIVDNILNWAKYKQTAELKKKGGSKRSKLTGITKLDDANCAGSNHSQDCTLILTEGDSAKALAISGLGVVGRDYYGVFPLKGKLLNVREASHAQIMKNEEIQNIAKILGLSFGKDYEDTSSFRYGHLMIMTDQDHDGSHIKGLLINFLHHFWPSLLKINGFLQQFITPIVKCTKNNKEKTFFTIPEYQTWREMNNDGKGYKIKYYKGLGTSTSAEAKEYFSHLETHQVEFKWDAQADDMVDMAFAKKRVDDRKLWLLNMEPGTHIDYGREKVTYNEFINQELILFSHADNERSIPHFMDGFKPSQRKVLFACFKRNLKQEIKVAQLAGFISEHSAYHHGEASLTQTIIGMAQNYVGSNNINLLSPCGQFGTRLMGGKDAASPRYVFTKLEPITRCIFHPDDDALLDYLDDDGQSIEPTYYVPVIPMVLVNGSDGIGTGWSTNVPTFNPREIIGNLRRIISGQQPVDMKPWYRGFIGDVDAKPSGGYNIAGIIDQIDDSAVLIKELPVGKWTTDYKQFLESMLIGNVAAPREEGAAPVPAIIKDFKENHTDTTVSFTISLAPEKLAEIIAEKTGIYKKFKLESSVSLSNMNLFDLNSQIKKFESASDILFAFYDVRVEFYKKRKAYLLNKLTDDWEQLDNKVRFILEVIAGKIVVSNRKKHELLNELARKNFKTFGSAKSSKHKDVMNNEEEDDSSTGGTSEDDSNTLDKGYDYLLSMKIWSLTQERVIALTAQRDEKKRELVVLENKSPEHLWEEDLTKLEVALDAFEGEIVEANRLEGVARAKATNQRNKGKMKARKVHGDDDDDDDEMIDDDDDFEFEKKSKAKQKAKAAVKKDFKAVPVQTQGVLIPRKIVVEKAVVLKELDKEEKARKPVKEEKLMHKSVKENAPKPVKVKDIYDIDSDDSVIKSPPFKLSLAERLASKKYVELGGNSSSSPLVVPKLKVQNESNFVNKNPLTMTTILEDEYSDDNESAGIVMASKLVKPTAERTNVPSKIAKKSTISRKQQEESNDDKDDDSSFEGDSNTDDDAPKKKKKAATTKRSKAVTSGAQDNQGKLKKPAVKPKMRREDSDEDSSDSDRPARRAVPKKKVEESSLLAKLAPPARSKPRKIAAATTIESKHTKKMKVRGNEDSDDDFDEDIVVEVRKTPKPTRQRKALNYAQYGDSEEVEEEEEEDASSSDDY